MIISFISKKAVKRAATFLLVVAFSGMVFAEGEADKVGSVHFKFLNIQNDARSAALGGMTAQSSGAQALFNNPAGITGSSMGLSAGVNTWLVETSIMNVGFVMPLAGGTIGLSMINVNYGDIMGSGWSTIDNEFAFDPNAGKFTASDLALGISYGMSLSEKFTIGFTAKMISETIDDYKASGYAFDVGTQFNTGYSGIMLGAMISNFGPDVKPLDIPSESTYDEFPSMSLPMTFNFGIVGQAFGDENNGLVAGLNVAKYADMAQEFILNGEYTVAGMAKIRACNNLNNPQSPMSYGAGINLAGISVDLSMTEMKHFDSVMRISVGYSF